MHVIGRLLQTKASSTSAGEAISLDAAEVTFGGSTAVVRGQRVEGTAVGVRSRTISLDRDTVAVLRGHCGQNEQEQRFRCSGLVVRGGPNRRPSAFQELYRPSGQKRESPCCPAHRRLRWPAGFSAIISTVPGYTAEFRFVRGIHVGSPLERGVVGILRGPGEGECSARHPVRLRQLKCTR